MKKELVGLLLGITICVSGCVDNDNFDPGAETFSYVYGPREISFNTDKDVEDENEESTTDKIDNSSISENTTEINNNSISENTTEINNNE